ncbi:type II toxin-antitoxin system prevent-host-death family antitoxin [Myceligenerans crystallogenes]|uniref:Antitoxin n=1 Tax=Myceligenerans crystallogenes TaxID=316335 RepID=A0ABN2NLH3_9MICO
MRYMTATTASRGFSDLLDAVEHGDTVTITRDGRVIAEVRPARRRTVGNLRRRLANLPPLDAESESDIAGDMDLVNNEIGDLWANA